MRPSRRHSVCHIAVIVPKPETAAIYLGQLTPVPRRPLQANHNIVGIASCPYTLRKSMIRPTPIAPILGDPHRISVSSLQPWVLRQDGLRECAITERNGNLQGRVGASFFASSPVPRSCVPGLATSPTVGNWILVPHCPHFSGNQ